MLRVPQIQRFYLEQSPYPQNRLKPPRHRLPEADPQGFKEKYQADQQTEREDRVGLDAIAEELNVVKPTQVGDGEDQETDQHADLKDAKARTSAPGVRCEQHHAQYGDKNGKPGLLERDREPDVVRCEPWLLEGQAEIDDDEHPQGDPERTGY